MHGRLEVYTGPMFSGKTEGLIRRLREQEGRGHLVAAFKPSIDNRYGSGGITSHTGGTFAAQAISVKERIMLSDLSNVDIVGIDEAQFFDPWLVDEVRGLLWAGADVVMSGLDLNCWGEPFGAMPQLLCLADVVHKLSAICGKCGAPANRSRRIAESRADVLVGGKEAYEPACLRCFSASA
jgi:thymidine kinase